MGLMPTFLIIGAARSGTTALYNYIRQHPRVFMSPVKETNFFAYEGETLSVRGPGADYINNSITDLATYQALFEDAPPGAERGEASPLYLFSEKAPGRIREHVPDVRLIAVLRNPVDQAFSHYLYARRQCIEPLDSFVDALAVQEQRKKENWQPLFSYSEFPRYHAQLSRYYSLFPRDHIEVFLYEDFSKDPLKVISRIFRFIGVEDDFVPDLSYRPNIGGQPKSALFQNLIMKPHAPVRMMTKWMSDDLRAYIRDTLARRNLQRPPLPDAARNQLIGALRDDVLRLQDLIDRDLSKWLNPRGR
jgi:hypothetical protein